MSLFIPKKHFQNNRQQNAAGTGSSHSHGPGFVRSRIENMLGRDRVERIANHIPGRPYQGTPINVSSQPPPSVFDRPAVPPKSREDEHLAPEDADKELRGLIDSMVDVNDVDVHEASPPELTVKLLKHQVDGVQWMKSRENGKRKGGILADDMGLGKTIQAIALILGNKPVVDEEDEHKNSKYTRRTATLIVAPLNLLHQWEAEVKEKTVKEHTPTTFIYHNSNNLKKNMTLQRLNNFDIILTTYETLAAEWGSLDKMVKNKSKQTAPIPSSDDSSSSSSEPEALDSSDSEIVARKPKPKPKNLVKSKGKGKNAKEATGPLLFTMKYHRVILDEAHRIKSRNSKGAKACYQVDATYRWCLTGTPIQNSVEDLYSLFKFLGKDIAGPFDDFSEFKQKVLDPIKRKKGKVAIRRLQVILKTILLRRTKTLLVDGKPILTLPPREIEVVTIPFKYPDERAFYDAVEKRIQLEMNRYVSEGDQTQYVQALVLLLRLRQACCHPTLVTKGSDRDAMNFAETKKTVNDPSELELDELTAALDKLNVERADEFVEPCFVCQERVVVSKKLKMDKDRVVFCEKCEKDCNPNIHLESSTKISHIVNILNRIKSNKSSQKTIIFSQFVTFFGLLEPFLKNAGYKFVRYDGKMSVIDRREALDKIRTDPAYTVILISLKCGSVGLNLTACNNVILSDLWWNPAIEEQAIDRVHRIGQENTVKVYKLTISETVEDRILKLQEQKAELARAALDGGSLDHKKLSFKDIMYLFGENHR